MVRLIRKRYFVALGLVLAGVVTTLVTIMLTPEPHELDGPVQTDMVVGTSQFQRSMTALYGGSFTGGNAITTLQNGDEIFPAMLEAITDARQSINFETYVYWSGAIAEQFASAIAERAAAGVEVNVLLDWQGSVPMERHLVDRMVEAGAQVERFRPVHWHSIDRFNSRTHRKLLIVDGRIGFTGGVGIADEWLGDARHPEEFRELHYRVEGPAVADMQGAFAFNWVEATGTPLLGERHFPAIEPAGDMPAQLVYSTTGSRNVMHLMLMTGLAAAQEHIRIGTAYFVPDEIAADQLIAARRRGVEVDILVPGPHTNKQLVRSASRHFWEDLLEAGVRFHEYMPTMYHAKVLMIDDQLASIGSANFDERSFRLNDEANLNVYDPAFVAEQIAIFEEDLAQSRPFTLEDWHARPVWQKLTDWATGLLRAQL